MMMRLKALWLCVAGAMVAFSLGAAESAKGQGNGQPESAKSYQIRNRMFGDLLRPEDAKNANGTPIVLYPAQPWKCVTWRFTSDGASRFHLQNHFTSKTFTANASGDQDQAAVTQVPFGSQPDQRPAWKFEKLSDGTYKISDARTGKVLTALKDAVSSRVKVVVRAWTDGEDQKWELIETDPKTLTM